MATGFSELDNCGINAVGSLESNVFFFIRFSGVEWRN